MERLPCLAVLELPRPLAYCMLFLAVCLAGAGPALAQREAETLSASFRKAAGKMLPAVVAVRPMGLVGRGVPYGILGRPVFRAVRAESRANLASQINCKAVPASSWTPRGV